MWDARRVSRRQLLQRLPIAAGALLLSAGLPAAAFAAPEAVLPAAPIPRRPFPDDNPWNTDISGRPVDPNSANLIASIGLNFGLHPDFGTVWNGAPNGIPY